MRRLIAIALSSTLILQAVPLVAAPLLGAVGGAQAATATGILNGTAQTSTGETLSNVTVQARNLATGQVGGTTASNAAGGFTFTGLNPASYIVEVVNETGAVIGSSAATSVVAGTTATVTVSTTAAAAVAGAAAGGAAATGAAAGGAAAGGAAAGGAAAAAAGGMAAGISTALVVTTVAVAAGIAGVVAVAADDASPSR